MKDWTLCLTFCFTFLKNVKYFLKLIYFLFIYYTLRILHINVVGNVSYFEETEKCSFSLSVHKHTHTHTHMYMYMYIYAYLSAKMRTEDSYSLRSSLI